jgi:hypothetical protein
MLAFPTSAVVRELPRREILQRGLPFCYWCEFTRPFWVKSAIAGEFLVPAGFLSNGASVPRLLWAILDDTHPDVLYAAYAHDYLFATNGELPGVAVVLTRNECNAVMRELMLDIGAPWWKAELVYWALVIGSRGAWESSRRIRQKAASTQTK